MPPWRRCFGTTSPRPLPCVAVLLWFLVTRAPTQAGAFFVCPYFSLTGSSFAAAGFRASCKYSPQQSPNWGSAFRWYCPDLDNFVQIYRFDVPNLQFVNLHAGEMERISLRPGEEATPGGS